MNIATPLPFQLEELSRSLVDCAFKVHHALGPGLLESVYEACLCVELGKRGIRYDRQVPIPVIYDGQKIDAGLRLDLLIDKLLIVEVKAVDRLLPIHQSQLLTYLKLADLRLGLLVNFNVALFKSWVKRIIR